jgi:transcriptional regulator with PAS, ATPase and Fis domain
VLAAALALQGFAVEWHEGLDDLLRVELACIEVAAPPRVGQDAIERACARGTRVLVIAEACELWSIGERCQVAVAGAAGLCDCLDAGFARRVATTLMVWHRDIEAQRKAELDDDLLRASLGIVGRSSALLGAWGRLRRAASISDLPLLLVGETGTGKELMARAAHRLDPRRNSGPWVALNCAAIAPALAEAELFGAERGSYTGAHRDRRGLLRAAEGGVLFLDEVGELTEEMQTKLLRALQEHRVMPVGSDREVPIDVRIVAATHRDLAARVREGRFREDLFYRLAVLPIELPPLRSRREDIPELVDYILARGARLRSPARHASKPVHEALALCDLPGNVRQLENLLMQATIAAGDDEALELAHLPVTVLRSLAPQAAAALAQAEATPSLTVSTAARATVSLQDIFTTADWKLADIAACCERELLAAALARTRGNQSSMARLLGVTPRCIYSKLRKHRLA